jgi:hypothetical protein
MHQGIFFKKIMVAELFASPSTRDSTEYEYRIYCEIETNFESCSIQFIDSKFCFIGTDCIPKAPAFKMLKDNNMFWGLVTPSQLEESLIELEGLETEMDSFVCLDLSLLKLETNTKTILNRIMAKGSLASLKSSLLLDCDLNSSDALDIVSASKPI